MTVTDPYTGIGVITRGVFDSDMAAISLSLHSSCNDIALNEKNSPSFCQIHFYRGIFHLLSSCTLSTLRAFNSSSFHPSSPQIHPFSMIPVTPQLLAAMAPRAVPVLPVRRKTTEKGITVKMRIPAPVKTMRAAAAALRRAARALPPPFTVRRPPAGAWSPGRSRRK